MAENVGSYNLIKRLATGGMGEVYLAKLQRGRDFEKLVTVKKLLPHLSHQPGFSEMFCSEASLSARLNHANIVQIYDFGDEDGNLWLAMEYVRGVDLGSLIARMKERRTDFGAAFALPIVRSVCRALDYAHRLSDENGRLLHLVHRDVTPSNVLVSFEGEIKLTDFGLASVRSREQFHDSAMAGKLPYLPPETIRGERVDQRSDIYALGLLLYELASGRKAFSLDGALPSEQAADDLLHRIVKGKTPWNDSETQEYLTPEILTLCSKASALEPGERYQSCKELLSEIEALLNPLLARGEGRDLADLLGQHFEAAQSPTGAFPEKTIVVPSGKPAEKTVVVGESLKQPLESTQVSAFPKKTEVTRQKPKRKRTLWPLVLILLIASLASAAYWFLQAPETGSLLVTSNADGATAVIPGQPKQPCPARFPHLPAETNLAATLQAPFHAAKNVFFRVKSGQETKKHVELERLTRMVKIQSNPPDAEVTLNDNKLQETTPLILAAFPLGVEQKILLTKPGYAPFEDRFTLTEAGDKPETKNYNLVPQQTRYRFETTPANTEITVGGRTLKHDETTPPVTNGKSLSATFTAKGFHTKTLELKATKQETETLRVALSPWTPQIKWLSRQSELGFSHNGGPEQKRIVATIPPEKDQLFTARTPEGFFAIRLHVDQFRDKQNLWRTKATCNFNAQPWARFFIDGQTRGETPVSGVTLLEGSHRIEFQLGNSETKYSLSLAIR